MTIKHLYPPAWPKVDFNFAAERLLDPRITFTRGSTGSYFDAQRILRYAAVDEPRFDHDPATGESLGLLIEEARTNLIANSQVFQTGYTVGNMTPTDNAVVAPDGTTTAASILETAVNDFHSLQISSTSQTDLSQSIFVKPRGRDNICLRFVTTGGDWYTITFNLTGNGSITQEIPGSISNWTINSKSIAQLSNGWYRISAGATTTAATTYMFSVLGCDSPTPTLADSYGFPQYVGDITKGYYVWGAQVEANSFPTSYIPTSGATEDRSLDSVEIDGDNFTSFFNYGDHTTVVEWSRKELNQLGYVYRYMSGNNQAAEFLEQLDVFDNNTVGASTWYGNGLFNTTLSGVGKCKAALAVTNRDSSLAVNGILAIRKDKAVSSGLTYRMVIGGNDPVQNVWNGHIGRIAYYPRRLSDEQLQALTA